MILITDYTLAYNAELQISIVVPGHGAQVCPCCGSFLTYRDSGKRIRKKEGGKKDFFLIRRLYCKNCHRLHNELPDCLVPYKHYDAETISGVLSDIRLVILFELLHLLCFASHNDILYSSLIRSLRYHEYQ